jgi:hypothetical protein
MSEIHQIKLIGIPGNNLEISTCTGPDDLISLSPLQKINTIIVNTDDAAIGESQGLVACTALKDGKCTRVSSEFNCQFPFVTDSPQELLRRVAVRAWPIYPTSS